MESGAGRKTRAPSQVIACDACARGDAALQEFLEVIFALPTVLFTVPLALSLLYWGFVIVGAADVDLLGGGESLVEGAAEGAAEGVAEGAAEGAAEAGGETGLAWVLSVLRLRSAPVTVVGSVFFLCAWMISFFGSTWLDYLVGDALPTWTLSSLVFVAASVGSLLLTSLAVRPLAPIFVHTTSRGGQHLVGKTCVVRTSRVDSRFGQAEMEDGGAGLLLHVRCEDDDNALHKGDEALVIEYDTQRDVYLVAPLKGLLPAAESTAKVPSLAATTSTAERQS